MAHMTENARLRIVVVDDDKVLAETLVAILQGCGFSATFFTNPLEALHSIRLDPPDLLISDVRMPELLGTDLAMLIKELCPSCKILLCSGQADTEDLLQAARARGHNFQLISKPIHPTDLIREIGNLRDATVSESDISRRDERANPSQFPSLMTA